jgi:hypothetical protein
MADCIVCSWEGGTLDKDLERWIRFENDPIYPGKQEYYFYSKNNRLLFFIRSALSMSWVPSRFRIVLILAMLDWRHRYVPVTISELSRNSGLSEKIIHEAIGLWKHLSVLGVKYHGEGEYSFSLKTNPFNVKFVGGEPQPPKRYPRKKKSQSVSGNPPAPETHLPPETPPTPGA